MRKIIVLLMVVLLLSLMAASVSAGSKDELVNAWCVVLIGELQNRYNFDDLNRPIIFDQYGQIPLPGIAKISNSGNISVSCQSAFSKDNLDDYFDGPPDVDNNGSENQHNGFNSCSIILGYDTLEIADAVMTYTHYLSSNYPNPDPDPNFDWVCPK